MGRFNVTQTAEAKAVEALFKTSSIMKALVICGDYWHPVEVPRKGLEELKENEVKYDWMINAHDWSPQLMAAYPLVILAKSNNVSTTDQTNWMNNSVQSAFMEYVRKGNGLLVIHSGTAEYDQAPVLRSLLGGVFSHHPEQCLVTMRPKAGHPFSIGSESFSIKDEHYFMAMDDPKVDVFMTTKSAHGEQPGAWRRVEGDGRVAVLTPGHNVEVWLHPSFRALLLNAMHWCSKAV
jgi:type 1 glutamine amidotransferase